MTSEKLRDLLGKSKVKPVVAFVKRPELLLLPNVPKPMHGTAPRIVLGRKWWDATRKAAYTATDLCCSACGVRKQQAKGHAWLEGHEHYEIDYKRGLMTYIETVALCHWCHNYIHSGRMKAMLDAGKLSHSKYASIIIHGDRVLQDAGLKQPKPHDGPMADWSKWRLVIDGRRYPGLFKCEADWVKYHEEKNHGTSQEMEETD